MEFIASWSEGQEITWDCDWPLKHMHVCVCVCVSVWNWGGGGSSLVGLSPRPVVSVTISKQIVSEFLWIAGHPAGVPENCLRTYMLSHPVVPTLCDPMDCSLQGSSVHGILPARILEWVTMPSFRGSSQPREEPRSPVAPTLQVDSSL